MAEEKQSNAKALLIGFAIGLTLLGVFGKVVKSSIPRQQQMTRSPTNYNYSPVRMCDDAVSRELDYSNKKVSWFDVELREGCFGPLITVPKSWHNWRTQSVDDRIGYWEAFWFLNDATGKGPFFPNGKAAEFQKSVSDPFRVQGFGTMRIFSNVEMPPAEKQIDSKEDAALLVTISHMDIVTAVDPHFCNKPSNALYEGIFDPKPDFLFDDEHISPLPQNLGATVNWAGPFKGTVPICFIVDEQGHTQDITVLQSPGPELEENIKHFISTWHYRPALQNNQPVRIQKYIQLYFEPRGTGPGQKPAWSTKARAVAERTSDKHAPDVSPDSSPTDHDGSKPLSPHASVPSKDTSTESTPAHVSAPEPLYKPDPPFSPEATKAHWGGIVSVKVLIKADGTVSDDMEILNAPPEMNLEKNIRDTVSKWRFKPAEKDGVPVAIKGTIQVTFRWR